MEYCRGLGYKDAPDYARLKVRLFQASNIFRDTRGAVVIYTVPDRYEGEL